MMTTGQLGSSQMEGLVRRIALMHVGAGPRHVEGDVQLQTPSGTVSRSGSFLTELTPRDLLNFLQGECAIVPEQITDPEQLFACPEDLALARVFWDSIRAQD